MAEGIVEKSWRSIKQLFTSKTLKYNVKKATSHTMLPPKKKYENNLLYLSTSSHRSFDFNNYEIVKQLIKRSCNDNDVVSLKSLIVLHHLIMNPETRNMLYLGTYFLNFSYDAKFNKAGRPVVIRKYGYYIDVLARNHTDCGLTLDAIRNRLMKSTFQKMPVANLYKVIAPLERMIQIILNFDLPSIHCGNVLVYEVFRLVGMNVVSFMNCYTEAVLEVAERASKNVTISRNIHLINTYFILVRRVRFLHQFLRQHIFSDVNCVYDLLELSENQLLLLDNIKRYQDQHKTVPASVPSQSLQIPKVPIDILISLETTAPSAERLPQLKPLNSNPGEIQPFELDPGFQNALQPTPFNNNPEKHQPRESDLKKATKSQLFDHYQPKLLKLDDANNAQSILFSNNPQELTGLNLENVLQSTLIDDDWEKFPPFVPDSEFHGELQSMPFNKSPHNLESFEPDVRKAIQTTVPNKNYPKEYQASRWLSCDTNPFALQLRPTPVNWMATSKSQPSNLPVNN